MRGISLEHIRRFGRWASDTFRRYLYRDNQVFRFVGSAMVKATGLLGQLQMTQPEDRHVTIAQSEEDSDEDRFRVGGKDRRKVSMRPSPNALEVGISDSEWETDSQCEEDLPSANTANGDPVFDGPLECRWRSPGSSPERHSEEETFPVEVIVEMQQPCPGTVNLHELHMVVCEQEDDRSPAKVTVGEVVEEDKPPIQDEIEENDGKLAEAGSRADDQSERAASPVKSKSATGSEDGKESISNNNIASPESASHHTDIHVSTPQGEVSRRTVLRKEVVGGGASQSGSRASVDQDSEDEGTASNHATGGVGTKSREVGEKSPTSSVGSFASISEELAIDYPATPRTVMGGRTKDESNSSKDTRGTKQEREK